MALTILAVAFLALITVITIIGYRYVINSRNAPEGRQAEKCSICSERFDRIQLIERQIGDHKPLFFCGKCVMGLYADLGMKN